MKQGQIRIRIQRLPHGQGLDSPHYASTHAAGADLRAAIDGEIVLQPGEHTLIPTGFAMALPNGFEAQVRPRSGLALKHGITVLNTPGTIDADYRGEVGVILINLGQHPFHIQRGDRIAQMIIAPVTQAIWHEAETLDATERSSGGFGSSGNA
ncbi:MAG: dUTP diphosphatase [Mariprofundaceae bacterium]|nr:dUTP diphosphatase [Mariprofundaceae bacterium]